MLCALVAVLTAHAVAATPEAHAGAVISNSGCTANSLAANDDNGSGSNPLGFTMNWFGTNRSTININNNGGVQLDGNVFSIYSGVDLSNTGLPIIVPLFADLDTRGPGTSLVTWGPLSSTFEGRTGYCVNWVNVGRYNSQPPTLSAQLLILNRSDRRSGDFDLVFNYDTINDGGVLEVGYASGVPGVDYYRFTGSQIGGYFRDSSPTGLVNYNSVPAEYSLSSRSQLGRYVFQSFNGSIAVASGPGTPGAPTGLSAASTAPGQASLSWTAPSSTGASAIADYVIEYSSNSGGTWTTFADGTSTATTATVTGLTNGTAYIFRVAAANAQGTGGPSAQSSPVTPANPPSAPTSLTATPSDGSASIAFTAGADGGSAITNYEVSVDGGAYTALSPADTTSPITVTGLTNGTLHTIKLRAINAMGDGAESAAVTVTPRTTPAAPTISAITTGDLSLSVALSVGGTGGSAITGYEYSTDDGSTWRTRQDGGGTTSPLVITALSTNGTTALGDGATYQVRIRAVNAAGSGTQSAATSATAVNVPGTVTAPSQPVFESNRSGQEPGDFVISNFSPSDTLLVSVGFVDPPAGTTFTLPTTTGLTAGYGYDFTGGKTQISFTGTQANANAALAAMTVATGSSTGSITIRVTASVNAANTYYNPINGSFYLVVTRAGTFAYNASSTGSSAWHLAETHTLHGLNGYLATITSAQEQRFIYTNVNVSDFWIGASDDVNVINAVRGAGTYANQAAAEGNWHWVSGPEAGQRFWQGAASGLWIARAAPNGTLDRTAGNASLARYENWCAGNAGPAYTLTAGRSMGEPNNSGGEHFALEKWGGATCWNDWGQAASGTQSYYLVEFSENFGTGASARGSFGGTDYGTTTVTAQVGFPPRNVTASAGNASATVTWDAPSSGAVSGYTVAASPQVDGVTRTCTPSPATARTCTVTGLAGGTAYSFTVTATFSDGKPDTTSLASSDVTPLTTPSAPTALAATHGDGTMQLQWAAPSSDGGSAITGYEIEQSTDGTTWTAPSGTIACAPASDLCAVVTGLPNGTPHRFRVRAVSSVGPGPWATTTSSVTSSTRPSAPTSPTLTPGDGTTTVSWNVIDDGGDAISSATIEVNDGTGWTTATTTACPTPAATCLLVTGLQNGTAYDIRVALANVNGTGSASTPATVTPRTVPSAPQGVRVSGGVRSVSVVFAGPASTGGAAIANYAYQVSDDGGASWSAWTARNPPSTASPMTIHGLADDTAHLVRIRAVNAAGGGTPAADETARTFAVPDAPTAVQATPGVGLATVTWGAPASSGGAPITGYTVTASPGGQTCTWTTGALACVVTGLANGIQHTFTVTATSEVGTGAPSAPSAAVTPRLATVPVESVRELVEESANVTRGGAAKVALACGEGGACTTEIVMRIGNVEIRSSGTLEPGQSTTTTMALPPDVQRRLARRGAIEVTIRITIASAAGTITVDVPVALRAPPAERTTDWSGRPRTDGSTDLAAQCVGTRVSRCEGEITLYADDPTVRTRQGGRVIVGSAPVAGPAGSPIKVNVRLNRTGRALLSRTRTLRIAPEVLFDGATAPGRVAPYRISIMTEHEWLEAALRTLWVGGRPRLDLNLVLDGVRAGSISRASGARIIERRILRKRLTAQAAALALPEPPGNLRSVDRDLQRAFDLSITANRHYIHWLRSGSDASWDAAWRTSLRATATKARLMQRFETAGKRHRVAVPPATSLWP